VNPKMGSGVFRVQTLANEGIPLARKPLLNVGKGLRGNPPKEQMEMDGEASLHFLFPENPEKLEDGIAGSSQTLREKEETGFCVSVPLWRPLAGAGKAHRIARSIEDNGIEVTNAPAAGLLRIGSDNSPTATGRGVTLMGVAGKGLNPWDIGTCALSPDPNEGDTSRFLRGSAVIMII